MKKVIKALIVFVLGFLLIGCNNYSPKHYIDQVVGTINQELSADDSLITSIDNKKISFISNHPEIISEDGVITAPSDDTKIIITVIIEIDGVKYSQDVEVLVKGSGEEKPVTNLSAAIEKGLGDFTTLFNTYDKENYTGDNYKKLQELFGRGQEEIRNIKDSSQVELIIDNYTLYFDEVEQKKNILDILFEIEDDLDSVLILSGKTISSNITLKTKSLYNSTIIWKSSNPDILSTTGVVSLNVNKTKVTLSYDVEIDGTVYEGIAIDIYVNTSINLPSYYKSINLTLRGVALKKELRTLITSTHKKILSYNDLKSQTAKTDADLNKKGNIILIYTRESVPGAWNVDVWNREHIWPQSKGWFSTSGAGADIHHLRPSNPSANSSRDNKPYGEISNRDSHKQITKSGLFYGYSSGGYFEPRDEVKGDIARIIFYLLVRYSESDGYRITSVASSMDMLLKWNEADPVDELEQNRNQKAYEIQGNRNPFIDNPDFASQIFSSTNLMSSSNPEQVEFELCLKEELINLKKNTIEKVFS